MVVGLEETGVVEQGHCYFDGDEQAAVVAVPDSNGSKSVSCCDAMTLR